MWGRDREGGGDEALHATLLTAANLGIERVRCRVEGNRSACCIPLSLSLPRKGGGNAVAPFLTSAAPHWRDAPKERRISSRLRGNDGMADLTDLASAAPPVRSRTRARHSRFGLRQITLTLLILFLAYQVIVPFLMIIWTSLKMARPGEAEFLELTFTLANY